MQLTISVDTGDRSDVEKAIGVLAHSIGNTTSVTGEEQEEDQSLLDEVRASNAKRKAEQVAKAEAEAEAEVIEAAKKAEAAEKRKAAAAAKKKAEEEAAAKAAEEKEDEAEDDFADLDGDDEKVWGREEVRSKMKEYAALEGKKAAIDLLHEHEAESIGALDEKHFPAIMTVVMAALEKAGD